MKAMGKEDMLIEEEDKIEETMKEFNDIDAEYEQLMNKMQPKEKEIKINKKNIKKAQQNNIEIED